MKNHPLQYLAAVAVALLMTQPAAGQTDRVKTTSGVKTGTVTQVGPLGVTVERSGRETPISVAAIRSIQFGDEPSELTKARVNALSGAYAKALESLAQVDAASLKRDEVKQEVEFYAAYCRAKQALVGEGSVSSAGSELNNFVKNNRQSFHFLEANELLGDLLVALGRSDDAVKRYEVLARSRLPAFKIRSAVLVGKTLQAAGQHDEAIQRFSQAEAMAGDSDDDKPQLLAAQLGRAVSLGATGKVDEGVELVRSVIAEADPEEQQLHADAYNALGGCYLLADRTKEALFAYLHVDLLYDSDPAAHAEALYHLGQLWEAIGQSSKALDARKTLKAEYASSKWANR